MTSQQTAWNYQLYGTPLQCSYVVVHIFNATRTLTFSATSKFQYSTSSKIFTKGHIRPTSVLDSGVASNVKFRINSPPWHFRPTLTKKLRAVIYFFDKTYFEHLSKCNSYNWHHFLLSYLNVLLHAQHANSHLLSVTVKAKFHYARWFELKFGLSSSLLAAN